MTSNQTKKGIRKLVYVKSKNKLQKNPFEDKYRKESEAKENSTRGNICDSESVNDLSSPGLCSALQLANEIKAASSTGACKVEELKLFQQKQLDEAIKQKAVKKANVPFTKHIFRDLVDLHISDQDFTSNKTNQKNVNFSTKKDPLFRLEDFYKPDFSTEFSVQVPIQKFEIEKIDYYNGFEVYERLEALKKLAKQ